MYPHFMLKAFFMELFQTCWSLSCSGPVHLKFSAIITNYHPRRASGSALFYPKCPQQLGSGKAEARNPDLQPWVVGSQVLELSSAASRMLKQHSGSEVEVGSNAGVPSRGSTSAVPQRPCILLQWTSVCVSGKAPIPCVRTVIIIAFLPDKVIEKAV